jgi:hypothetical protein
VVFSYAEVQFYLYHTVFDKRNFPNVGIEKKIYRTLSDIIFTFLYTKGKTQIEVSVYRLLKGRVGSEREEVAGGWRRLDNEEHHNLYTSPYYVDKLKKDEMDGHAARVG